MNCECDDLGLFESGLVRFYVDMSVHVYNVFLILFICYLVSFDGCFCFMTFLIMLLICSLELGCTILSCSSVIRGACGGSFVDWDALKAHTPMVVSLMIGIHLKFTMVN